MFLLFCHIYYLIGMKQVSDRDIREITSKTNLLHADLQRMFHALGMTHAEIENAERNTDSRDVTLQASRVLNEWRMKNGRNACRSKILEALLECNLVDAKEILEATWGFAPQGKSSNPSLHCHFVYYCGKKMQLSTRSNFLNDSKFKMNETMIKMLRKTTNLKLFCP